ncbi:Uncharacterised protein [Serratia fonticola]|uniref:Uncharacterized protein n=1 Tax=Serratia fonticola TaxID=47917 RepID=A0A4U9UM33_SERFO|nr:Uncharacterised protein [Serratia fonticola]
MRIPAMAIMENISVIAPPSTGAGDSGKEAANDGEQPQHHQDHGDIFADMTRGDTGHLDHAVILGKCRQWQRAQHGGNHRYQPIGQHSTAQACGIFIPLMACSDTIAVAVILPTASNTLSR